MNVASVWTTVHLVHQNDVNVLQNMKTFSWKLKEYNCFYPCIDLCTSQSTEANIYSKMFPTYYLVTFQ